MIRICSKCGALLLQESAGCSFCEPSGGIADGASELVGARVAAPENLGEPEWRVEVTRRLQIYRARRGRLRPDDSQSGLPFSEPPAAEDAARERPRARPAPKTRHIERMEIYIQPELDFSSSPDDRAHPQTALVPVATLAERRWAAVLDALFLGLTCAGFAALFRSLGGEVVFDKMDALVSLAVLFLFYALYFSLFTALAGATPGMQLRALTIVRLDGSLPDTPQLLWRSFGYMLSGATLMLGFLWALWDEDRFTWHDRISQTYITAAAPILAGDFMGFRPSPRPAAHK